MADRYGGRCESERFASEERRPERSVVGDVDTPRDLADGCGGSDMANAQRERSQGLGEAGAAPPPAPRPFAWPPGPGDLHAWGRVPVESQPKVCRVADGVPNRVARLKALGNAIVPQCSEVIGRIVVDLESARLKKLDSGE